MWNISIYLGIILANEVIILNYLVLMLHINYQKIQNKTVGHSTFKS